MLGLTLNAFSYAPAAVFHFLPYNIVRLGFDLKGTAGCFFLFSLNLKPEFSSLCVADLLGAYFFPSPHVRCDLIRLFTEGNINSGEEL